MRCGAHVDTIGRTAFQVFSCQTWVNLRACYCFPPLVYMLTCYVQLTKANPTVSYGF